MIANHRLSGHGIMEARLKPLAVAALLVATAATRLWLFRLTAPLLGRSTERALSIMQRWNRRAWHHLRLTVSLQGAACRTPCIYIANHRTYLDIPVLNGLLAATFLSRADVGHWHVFGAVAREIGTVFVDRTDPRGRVRAARALLRRIRTASVIVFPEATTGGDRLPGHFQPGLFRLLRRAGVPIVPVTLRYSDRRAYWVEDLTLWEHLRSRVFAGPPLRCVVHLGSPVKAQDYGDEAALNAAVYAAICHPITAFGELCP